MVGQTIAHYRITAKLGAGGMGEVYRARDEQLRRDVALKVLPASNLSDPAARARLLREARAAGSLNHPNICTIHEVGEAEGQAYIAMELVEGQPLSERLQAGPLSPEMVLRYGAQIADALAHAHERQIVHRDLKSANVVITRDARAKVLDFGLAKQVKESELEEATRSQASLTQVGQIAGTLAYMSPEQLRGQPADARSDIWALGVLLYEMATGKRPFAGATGFTLSSAILRESPAPLGEDVPPGLRAVIQRCLAKEAELRYQRASEVRAALETAAAPSSSGTAIAAAPRVRRIRWHWPVAALTLIVCVALALALNVGGLRGRLFPPASLKVESLAVLPLENLSRDPAQEFFADGMTESLITELSKIGALKIISRTSAMQYKGTKKSMPQVARELGVDGVIEGSVLREGDQVRVTVQLIHGRTDEHLWAGTFDREMRSVLALHSEVAKAVADEIKIKLTPQEQTRLASARTVHPKAYELYVLGRHHWSQRTLDDHRQAIDYYRQALELDPGYAQAYAALADAYILVGEQGGLPQAEAWTQAEAAVRKALELDATLAEVNTSLGILRMNDWNWLEAEQAFRRAIELNPSYALAHQHYGRALAFAQRFDEAMRELERARELDPLSVTTAAYIGQAYFFARKYDAAAEQLQHTLQVSPNHALVLHLMGEVDLARGRLEEAIGWFEKSLRGTEQPSAHFTAMLGCAYARAGRRGDALKILKQLQQRWKQGLVSSFDIASLHAALGENERALEWLERGYQQRDRWLRELKVWPWFDALINDPRYQDLLRRTGLSPQPLGKSTN